MDLPTARAQGFVVDVESLRAAIADEDAWQQEYCCRFLSQAAHFIPPELVVAAEHPAATIPPLSSRVSPSGTRDLLVGPCYLGVDIGRKRDLTVLWLVEVENPHAPADARTYLTRGVLTLDRQPFAAQRATLDALLALRFTAEPELSGETFLQKGSPRTPSQDSYGNASGPPAGGSDAFRQKVLGERENSFAKGVSRGSGFTVRRCAVDATGLGLMLAEELAARWGARVEPVTFTGAVKEDLAVRVKRLLEERRLKLPYDPTVRAALGAVKRYVTPAGNIRFDADRTDQTGHADHFWALALALAAADEPALSVDYVSTSVLRPTAQTYIF